MQGVISELIHQRDNLSNRCLQLAQRITELEAQLAKLSEEEVDASQAEDSSGSED